MTIKIANRLQIDFDTLPLHVASALADSIEKFINENHQDVRLHGTCAALDDETMQWEVQGRHADRVAELKIEKDLQALRDKLTGEQHTHELCLENFGPGGRCNYLLNHDGNCNPVKGT